MIKYRVTLEAFNEAGEKVVELHSTSAPQAMADAQVKHAGWFPVDVEEITPHA